MSHLEAHDRVHTSRRHYTVPRCTTGGDGLQMHVPIERRYTHAQTREFARLVAGALVRDAKMSGHGQQIVSVYSVRPLPGARVSTPVSWHEPDEDLDPRDFTLSTVLDRVEQRGDLAAPLLQRGRRLDKALEGAWLY